MVSFSQLPAVKKTFLFCKNFNSIGLNLIRSCPKCFTHLIAVHSRLVIKKKTTKCFNPANDAIPRDSSQYLFKALISSANETKLKIEKNAFKFHNIQFSKLKTK